MVSVPPAGRLPGTRLSRWADRHSPFFLLAPLVLVVAAVVVYPLGYSLWVSLVDYDSAVQEWVGLRHYRAVVEYSAFPAALLRTAGLCCAAVAIEFTLGLLLALSVASGGSWRRKLIPLLLLPAVAGGVTAGLFWRVFLDAGAGPANFLLGEALGRPVTIDWLSNTWLTYAGIVLADAWQWTPIVFLILYAGLRTIPSELYEAADLDGATPSRSFVFVTLPLLAPFAVLALLLRFVDGMKLFDVPVIFGGKSEGTETAALYLYGQGFTSFHLGFASAGSWLFVLAIAIIACPLLVLVFRPRWRWA